MLPLLFMLTITCYLAFVPPSVHPCLPRFPFHAFPYMPFLPLLLPSVPSFHIDLPCSLPADHQFSPCFNDMPSHPRLTPHLLHACLDSRLLTVCLHCSEPCSRNIPESDTTCQSLYMLWAQEIGSVVAASVW